MKRQQHQHKTLSGDDSSIDRAFISCLNEIEKIYTVLPKNLRIRVEKWVAKLSNAGNNVTWNRHRNSYAKLLMNMVSARQLSEPFHTSPPEGSLPTFPVYLKSYTNHLQGPHESHFWREIYHQIGEGMVTADLLRGNSTNADDIPIPYKTNGDVQQRRDQQAVNAVPVGGEIFNLTFLVKEQGQRIQLLELQLHEERIKHELQLQRMQLQHRIEVAQLRPAAIVSGSDHQQNSTTASTGMSSQPTTFSGLNKTGSAPHRFHVTSPATASPSRPMPQNESLATADAANAPSSNSSYSPISSSIRLHYQNASPSSWSEDRKQQPQVQDAATRAGTTMRTNPWVLSEDSNFPRALGVTDSENQTATVYLREQRHRDNDVSLDIAPRSFVNMQATAPSSTFGHPFTPMPSSVAAGVQPSHFDPFTPAAPPDLVPNPRSSSSHNASFTTTTGGRIGEGDLAAVQNRTTDEEFLNYIEKFQKDISFLGQDEEEYKDDDDVNEVHYPGHHNHIVDIALQQQQQSPSHSSSYSPAVSRSRFAEEYIVSD